MQGDSRKSSVGFVGLGDMGAPMTANLLLKAARAVVVYDLQAAKVKQSVDLGEIGRAHV